MHNHVQTHVTFMCDLVSCMTPYVVKLCVMNIFLTQYYTASLAF